MSVPVGAAQEAGFVLLALLLALQGPDCDGYLQPLVVPAGFCVRTFAQHLGAVRHLVVHPSGTLVAAINGDPGLVRLRDTTGDGTADEVVRFGPGEGGTGIGWANGWLYFAADKGVMRYRWPASATAPTGSEEWIAPNLPVGEYGSAHTMKGLALARDGTVYVSIGSESDNCQVHDRAEESPGKWPCTELERRAGIWAFRPPPNGGLPWLGSRFATGLRNAEAITIDPVSGRIWAVTQGRDFLNRTWHWSDAESANQPAEMLEQIVADGDYGWPYCQGSWSREGTRLIRAPEYQNQVEVDCALKLQPVMGFPGHWAPIAAAAANGALPARYRNGIFIAFHGSRSRAPLPEDGYYVVFVPFDENHRPTGESQLFLRADAGPGAVRFSGVTVAPDGNIYVSDDGHGIIYRIEPHAPARR